MPLPGERVLVYDAKTYTDDLATPWLQQYKPATVVKWYGQLAEHYPINDFTLGPYPCLYDVVFDERPSEISRGHFSAENVETIKQAIANRVYKPKCGEQLLEKAASLLEESK